MSRAERPSGGEMIVTFKREGTYRYRTHDADFRADSPEHAMQVYRETFWLATEGKPASRADLRVFTGDTWQPAGELPISLGGYHPTKKQTWLAAEELAYPKRGQTRKGTAFFPDGKIRRVWAGIADSVSTIPAHAHVRRYYIRGCLSLRDDGELVMNVPITLEWIFRKGERAPEASPQQQEEQ